MILNTNSLYTQSTLANVAVNSDSQYNPVNSYQQAHPPVLSSSPNNDPPLISSNQQHIPTLQNLRPPFQPTSDPNPINSFQPNSTSDSFSSKTASSSYQTESDSCMTESIQPTTFYPPSSPQSSNPTIKSVNESSGGYLDQSSQYYQDTESYDSYHARSNSISTQNTHDNVPNITSAVSINNSVAGGFSPLRPMSTNTSDYNTSRTDSRAQSFSTYNRYDMPATELLNRSAPINSYFNSNAYGPTMEGLPENPDVQSQRFVSSELPKLQRPLEPRDYSDSDLGISQSLPKFDNIPSILRHRGQTLLRKNAFICLDAKGKEISALSWEKLSSRAEKVAHVMRDKSGLYRGDRVALLYSESEVMDFVVALLGCFLAGLIGVPINPASEFKDIRYILNSIHAHLVLTTDTNLKNLNRVLSTKRLSWPKNIEWWKTNEFGSYHSPSKKSEPPALQVPDLAYIEFSRSPIGELRGVVLSHRTILHQMTCLEAMLKSKKSAPKRPTTTGTTSGDLLLCNLDVRQSIGLIVGVLLTIYSGNTTVWVPQAALQVDGLYANIITRYRIDMILSDYPGLKQVAYNYQSFPHLTRNFSKKQPVDLSSVKWCLIDALTVDTEFHEVLQDRWFKPLGNKNYRDIVAPMLTLSEHGGMVISMRDWLKGQEKMGCPLENPLIDDENCDPTDLSEVLLNKTSLSTNKIKIVTSSPSRNTFLEDTKKYIRVGAFGYPLPDATLAIVNPETCVLAQDMELGEIWIDSPSLSGGFWGLSKETVAVFHATCYDNDVPIDMEFLRTGLLGFIYNGKVYVLGLYEDRLRQKIDWSNREEAAEAVPLQISGKISQYRYHYTSHLVHTIMRTVQRVFDCSAFDTFVNNEFLPVVVLESPLATPPVIQTQTFSYDWIALNDLAEKAMESLFDGHRVRVYCVLITPPNSLPRIVRSGRSEIGNMLCKRQFDLGKLPAVYVKFGIEKAVRSLPVGPDLDGGIWSPAVSQMRSDSLYRAEKQYSGVDFRDIVIDDRTSAPLSDFESIIHIFRWRVLHQADELAFSTIANKSKEGPGLSWKKFDRKIATVALMLRTKLGLRDGDHAILMHTHSEDFVVAVYACLVLGIIPIPIAPIDEARLDEDVPALLNVIKDYSVKAILVNPETDSALKAKAVSHHLKDTASVSKLSLPPIYNTCKPKMIAKGCKEMNLSMKKEWLSSDHTAIVWLYWTPDHRRIAVRLSHSAIMGMAKVQKETCQMSSTKPVVGCVRSVSGLGFIHTCIMGVYLGASTYIVSPIDYAHNPSLFFLTLSRYKVKDTYTTPQMLYHAIAKIRPKGYSLADTKNLIVACDGRPRTDLCNEVRMLFSRTGLESMAINMSYSHTLNPMVTTRSYMSLEPINVWLDPIALRRGYVSIVSPETYPKALHLQDSGMVPVGTQVAIVNPETCRLCKVGEYGEIWIYSEGNVSSFYKSRDQFQRERFHGVLQDQESATSDIQYVRTGDLGFLHTITRPVAGSAQVVELQTLFVLGPIGETFEVLGLNHFPIDIEHSIENSHASIVRGGTAVFQAGGLVIAVIECTRRNKDNLAAIVPVIVNTVLEEHQFIVDIVSFVSVGHFPRSRLGEKQRGKILASWVTRKLPLTGKFGVSNGEQSLFKALKFSSPMMMGPIEEVDPTQQNVQVSAPPLDLNVASLGK